MLRLSRDFSDEFKLKIGIKVPHTDIKHALDERTTVRVNVNMAWRET
jgi:hypothetical protein